MGASLATGDFNGDGTQDLLIGSDGIYREELQVDGGAYLVYGPLRSGTHGLADRGAVFVGETRNSVAGGSVAAPDLNGDGFDDVVIGASGDTEGGGAFAGAVYVIYGGPTL